MPYGIRKRTNGKQTRPSASVLPRGYDDTAAEPCWIILNSHFTEATRPHNLFRLSQNIDYSATFVKSPYPTNRVYNWVSLNTTFAARNTTTPTRKGLKSISVSTNTGSKTPADSIHVVSAAFETAPANIFSGNLKVNYQTFVCDSSTGKWKKTGNTWQFKSKLKPSGTAATKQPAITVTIDTKKKTWSASVLHADLRRTVNPGDGIMCKFEYKAAESDADETLLSGGAAVYDQLALRSNGLIKGP